MCDKKCYDIISVIISLLGGIVFAILAFLNFISSLLVGPSLALSLALFSLLALVLSATSLLRQNVKFNECLCQKAKKLLVSSILLFSVAAFTLVFLVKGLVLFLILTFILSSLTIYVLFSLYCLILCISTANCRGSSCD